MREYELNEVREVIEGSYRIIYLVKEGEEQIEVLAVIHSSREGLTLWDDVAWSKVSLTTQWNGRAVSMLLMLGFRGLGGTYAPFNSSVRKRGRRVRLKSHPERDWAAVAPIEKYRRGIIPQRRLRPN